MTDPIEPTITPDADTLPVAQARTSKAPRLPLVWIIPAIAILIGGWLAVKSFLETGPTITIHFQTAEGLEAGKTRIRYKSVNIGDVKTIKLAKNHKGVVVTAQMRRDAAELLVKDTRFWVVRPRVAGGQISGLTTLLSGSYIGLDIGKSDQSQREFDGLDIAPNITADEPGREFTLKAPALGSLDVGSPVYYRQVQVGEVTGTALNADGSGVTVQLFVRSPYEKFVRDNTRFWQASGLDVTVDTAGIRLQTQSLVSILLGGVAFQEPADNVISQPAAANKTFTLFADQTLAMKRDDAEVAQVVAYFSESVRGLSVGAPIDFQGIVIGEVKSIDLQFDPETRAFRFPVEMNLYADRLRSRNPKYAKQTYDARKLMISLIERGLRAQMRSSNLLTGQRYIALDFFPNVKPFKISDAKRAGKATPEMPTVTGSLEELQVTLANIAKKIDRIPFDELGIELKQTLKSLQVTMNSTEQLVQRLNKDVAPELAETIIAARKTMAGAEKLLASDSPAQQDLHAALVELTRAARSLRVLTDYLERQPQSLIFGKPADKAGAEK